MADSNYKGQSGIMGSRILQERELELIDRETGKKVGTFTAESGSNILKWNEKPSGTQLKFSVQDDGVLDISYDDLTIDIMSGDPDYDGLTPIYIWADPVIFDDETKRLFLELPISERPRFTTDLIEQFYNKRPEYNNFARRIIYDQPIELLNLFKSLTPEDFEALKIGNAEFRFDQLQKQINRAEEAIAETPIDTDKLTTIWPILSIRELFLESELSEFYYLKNPKKSARELAAEQGAIMTTGGRLADISNKDYSGWLNERPNKYAYISYTGDKYYFDKIEADPDGNLYEQLQRSVSEQDKRARKAIKDGRFYDGRPTKHEHINSSILQALLKVALDNPRSEDDRYFYIHVPTLAKELNEHYITSLDEYDEHGKIKEEAAQQRSAAEAAEKQANADGEKTAYNPPNFMDLITDLNYWVGVLNGLPTQLVSINQVDYKSNTIRVDLPYVYDVIRANDDKRKLDAEKKEIKVINPGYNFLLHSSIATEKDKIAVDLAITIINRILQRGTKNYSDEESDKPAEKEQKTITLKVKYKDLIEETPALKMAYNGASSKYKYDILNRKFKLAFKILKKKTDIYDYYVELNIPNTPPTTKTLDNYLIITHKGINKEYKIKRV